MSPFITVLLVLVAIAAIFGIRKVVAALKFNLHKDAWVDQYLKFQSIQMLLAFLFLGIFYLIAPENFVRFFQIGNLNAPISEIRWLGVTAGTAWLEIALTLGFWITFGTAIFMFFQLKKAYVKILSIKKGIIWVLLFSAMNAFSEEAIFRLGVVVPLYGVMSVSIIILISGILFGLPHYFGTPSGVIGVLMAGFLGWLLALAMLETQGFFIPWSVHFVQDVVILASGYLMQQTQKETVA